MKLHTLALVPLFALAHAGCADDVTLDGGGDVDGEVAHDQIGEEEPLTSLPAAGTTVQGAATTGACTTAVVRGLSEQLGEEV